jgi:cytochrome c oxidase cbb3-type subunit 3
MEPAAIAEDPALRDFALSRGARLFADNCAACHGQAGVGQAGFPNLTNDDWLWGGGFQDIQRTLEVGVNSDIEDTREKRNARLRQGRHVGAG